MKVEGEIDGVMIGDWWIVDEADWSAEILNRLFLGLRAKYIGERCSLKQY